MLCRSSESFQILKDRLAVRIGQPHGIFKIPNDPPCGMTVYDAFRTNLWTAYGFRDALNLTAGWWDPDVLGIDKGPFVLRIENHRSQRIWKRFMQAPQIQRGLAAAGFNRVAFVRP